ncbi:MAG: metallopeptidase family protein [candidate division WOR-3 bacterium]|jgi:predicted Zn-dependent protease with MMP-like domain
MERERFAELVREALDDLPPVFRSKMHNIEVVVEEEPVAQSSLLGLYQGVPFKHRGVWYGNVLPDKITLFKRNIERVSRTEEEVREWVKKVLIHEIGHYFGFSEADLHRLNKP